MAKKLTQAKAEEMLHNPPHGKPLTDKQRRFFGAIAGGAPVKLEHGGKVVCPNCGHSWSKSTSSKKDMYVCHICGNSNVPKAQNGIEGTMGGLTDKGFNYNGAWGGPSMQVGGEIGTQPEDLDIKEIDAFEKAYTNSPRFAELSKKQGDSRKMTQKRRDVINNFDINKDIIRIPEGVPHVEDGKFYLSSDLGDWPNYSDVNAHELGHLPYSTGDLNFPKKTFKEIQSRNKEFIKKKKTGKTDENIEHDIAPNEVRADKNQLLFQLKKLGIYDATKDGDIKQEQLDKFKESGEWNRLQRLYDDKDILWLINSVAMNSPSSFSNYMAMGGSIPGAVGFTYARTGSIPSNGPYAKKTKASAQNGMEMKFYQEGLDWKPRNISRDGSVIPQAQVGTMVTPLDFTKPLGTLEGVSDVMSAPARTATYILTGKYQDPSQALGINNPIGAFITDAILDPTNLIGIGAAGKVAKVANSAKSVVRNAARNVINDAIVIGQHLDKKYIYPRVFKKEIEELKRVHELAPKRYASPEATKRLKGVFNVDPATMEQPMLTFEPHIGSHYSALTNNINVDLRQVNRLKRTELTSPKGVYEHEYGHFLQREADRNSESYLNKVKKYEKNLAKYNSPDNQKLLRDKNEWYKSLFSPGNKPVPIARPTLIDKYASRVYDVNPATGEMRNLPTSEIAKQNALYFPYRNVEQTAHLREMRQGMIDKGYIKNEYDPISRTTIRKFIEENPKDRISSFTSPNNKNRIKGLEKIFRNLPVVLPAVGVGAAAATQQKKEGGVIKDDLGQWAHPGEITEIQGDTMATHGYGDIPLWVEPNVGEPRLVQPNTGTHKFPGATKFKETPVSKKWLEKYVPKAQSGIVHVKDSSGKITDYDVNSDEYKKLYESGKLASYDEKNDVYVFPDLPEIKVTAPKKYDYEGCVSGVCHNYASQNNMSLEEFRKLNNVYGDAWEVMNNAYGEDVQLNPKDYSNLKVNDLVSLSRKQFKTDKEKGIPESNQHVGRVSKIVDGIPYVKHYVGDRYYEEPINNINEFTQYTPSRIKRLSQFKDLTYGKSNFNFDKDYTPNTIENEVFSGIKDKKNIQDILRLNSDEYDDLAKLAYGIIGAESAFGKSKRTAYRMVVPDFLQKLVKVTDDAVRNKDVYDENINNLSQGYASIKESSLHGVGDNTGKLNAKEVRDKIKSGDYKNLERTNNYLYQALQKFGLNPDNLEDGESSFKALMSALSWYKKRNPNATNDQLLKMYTGKKDISKYKNNVNKYIKNIDNVLGNSEESSTFDNLLGEVSSGANKVNNAIKNSFSSAIGAIRDISPLSVNKNQFIADLLGSKAPITKKSLSDAEYNTLVDIVKSNVAKDKFSLEYGDYNTSSNKNDDVGGGKTSLDKLLASDPNYALKTLLGQANIRKVGKDKYVIEDTFDYNDQGKSFGVVDDLAKRGPSAYALVRSLGRNYGSGNNQGSKVQIPIDLSKKKNGGWLDKYK